MKSMLLEFGAMFRKVKGNASEILFTQIVWSITFVVYTPFLTQYMLQMGMTAEQVGVVSAVTMAVAMVASLFGGWVTNKLGRRETYTLFDLVSWSLACGMWAISSNFIWFLVTGAINAVGRIGGVAHTCLLTEDTPPEDRIAVFSAMNVASIVAGFCSPLANFLINPFGLIKAMRIIYAGSAVIYTVIFVRRFFRLRETSIALQMKSEARGTSPLSAIRDYLPLMKYIWGNRQLMALILLRAIYFMQATLRSTYISVALIQGLGFKTTVMSAVNLINAAIMLIAQIMIIPRIAGRRSWTPLLTGMLISLAGNLALLFCPMGNMALMLLSIIMNAVGGVLCSMLIETLFANTIDDKRRAALNGFMTFVTMLLSIPVTLLYGRLIGVPTYGPMLPTAVNAFMFVCCIVILLSTMRAASGKTPPSSHQPHRTHL